jgi:hypothetical protein
LTSGSVLLFDTEVGVVVVVLIIAGKGEAEIGRAAGSGSSAAVVAAVVVSSVFFFFAAAAAADALAPAASAIEAIPLPGAGREISSSSSSIVTAAFPRLPSRVLVVVVVAPAAVLPLRILRPPRFAATGASAFFFTPDFFVIVPALANKSPEADPLSIP